MFLVIDRVENIKFVLPNFLSLFESDSLRAMIIDYNRVSVIIMYMSAPLASQTRNVFFDSCGKDLQLANY